MQFRNTANQLGLTRTEFIVITSLAGIFLAGLFIKYLLYDPPAPYRDFDYSANDSLFMASDSLVQQEEEKDAAGLLSESSETGRSLRSTAPETRPEKVSFRKKILAEENSIDINSAKAEDLMKLPGIGGKTAGRILELRNLKGRFNSVEDLLEVKGIGQAKLNKIRKYIFVK